MKTLKIFILLIAFLIIAASCKPTETGPLPTRSATQQLPKNTSTLSITATSRLSPKETPPPVHTPIPEPTASPALLLILEESGQKFNSPETVQAALGDLDSDGDLDAVLANPQRNNSQVWLNDGDGTFVDTGQKLTQYGHGVVLADFDSDGDLDAFITCHQFITPSKIYLNDGNGNLQDTGQDLGDAKMSGNGVNLLDLNRDGYIDVHVEYFGVPDKVYLNDGNANFSDSGLALDEESITWGDLDGDGDIDYFGKRWSLGYGVQLNDGSGQFTKGWQMDDSHSTVGGIALADFDNDGDLDALVANGYRETGSFPSLLLWNDGSGQFTDSGEALKKTLGADVAVGDLDNDGDLDVFIANMDRPDEVWLNDGGEFIDSGLQLGQNSDLSGKTSLGDLDLDGDLDVVVGRFNGGAEVWINTTLSAESDETVRSLLTYDMLMEGFDAVSPVDESALTMPAGIAPATHTFEGRLELLGEKDGGQMQVLRGELEPEYAYLPEFDFEFVRSNGYLIPKQRGLIIAQHPMWNIILEPGRVWQESGDGGYSRASIPFALTVKGGNATFNGTLTFLYSEQGVSKVWYQVTQETTSYTRANLWGLLAATYHPGPVAGAEQIRANFAAELAARLPLKPLQALAEDYPGVDVSAFGRGVTPEHLTWVGVVVNGVNYLGGCQTRFGVYPYCESMRATSYSTAKSAFVSVALMRLAQLYGSDVSELLIKDYVPEYAASPGDWERVTFNHTIDMTTGNYVSAGYMTDDDSQKMGEFFSAQPYAERIAAAFDCPNAADPGTRWVYRTSDTFILTRALNNYLQTQRGPDADIYQFVVDEIYRPLGLGPGVFTTMRTADNNWQGQAEGGYGLWWIPDDIAKIASLLNRTEGQIDGVQVLHPDLLKAALQRDPDDRGVKIDSQRMYNNAFWANHYTRANGFDCDFWVTQMLGVSGNVVALMPNGVTYYYFSDNQEFTWDAALREVDKIIPFCPNP
jgi:hypothetical protein